MSAWPACPSIYEINTWVWLHELARQQGRLLTLDEVPQAELERLAALGFDAVWLMGVWERSPAGRRVAREHPGLRSDYTAVLPDGTLDDVVGSPYAIRAYRVDPALGGDVALASLRGRLSRLGLRLILDFVPNHLALDHAWVATQPERLVQADAESPRREPRDYFESSAGGHTRYLAHGRDPYFPGWTDTVQVDYRRADTRRAMADLLADVAGRCDGLRCDMAMLVTTAVFRRTWGGDFDPPQAEFWPEAIARARAVNPDLLLLAEVYWDLEWRLLELGFDYAYDKRLYDRLVTGDVAGLRAHLRADPDFQSHLARFVENHDELRARAAFGPLRERAAATLALTLPGLRLLHDGQLEGHRVKLPVQLGRRPVELPDLDLEAFYRRLLGALARPALRVGDWRLLEPREAWPGNPSHAAIVAHRWTLGTRCHLVAVNLSAVPAQGYLPLDVPEPAGSGWRLCDVLGEVTYTRIGHDLRTAGLYLDLPPWGHHLFEVQPAVAS